VPQIETFDGRPISIGDRLCFFYSWGQAVRVGFGTVEAIERETVFIRRKLTNGRWASRLDERSARETTWKADAVEELAQLLGLRPAGPGAYAKAEINRRRRAVPRVDSRQMELDLWTRR
jgi:hypothetical protein